MPEVLARVERTITGDVILHLIRPEDMVQVRDGNEFFTVQLNVNPWES